MVLSKPDPNACPQSHLRMPPEGTHFIMYPACIFCISLSSKSFISVHKINSLTAGKTHITSSSALVPCPTCIFPLFCIKPPGSYSESAESTSFLNMQPPHCVLYPADTAFKRVLIMCKILKLMNAFGSYNIWTLRNIDNVENSFLLDTPLFSSSPPTSSSLFPWLILFFHNLKYC